jgi:hypothetical protein
MACSHQVGFDICDLQLRQDELTTIPEDPYAVWDGDGGPCLIAPIFTLYDYSFKPDDVPIEKAVEWAREHDIMATDEMLLHPDPYPTRQDWCAALIEKEEAKLAAANAEHPDLPLVMINHWPLRQDLVKLTLVPRFRIWCGTTKVCLSCSTHKHSQASPR